MTSIRAPAVAGYFYPDTARALHAAIGRLLEAQPQASPGEVPKAIIAPHAGYVYSGPVAAVAYAALRPAREIIERVVLVGPSHRVYVRGLALPGVDAFETPLGRVAIDAEAVARIAALPQVVTVPEAHAHEHSLEVQVPFLQEVLEDFTLVPLSAGEASAEEVAEVLELLWGGPQTLIVISSDLSHYHDYDTARRLDAQTTKAIETLQPGAIGPSEACGCVGISGLLELARRRDLRVRTLSLASSGDTAGPRDRVVGYGAYAVG